MRTNKQRQIRQIAGLVTLCVLAASCGGGSDEAETEASVPSTEIAEVPATEVATTVAATTTTVAVVEDVPVDIPSLPCAEYVTESGFPLKPCDSGVLVESLQRDLESLFPDIGIDGLFGQQTFGFVQEYQAANGLAETGVVSEELASAIAEADGIGESDEADTSAESTDSTDSSGDTESGGDAGGDSSAEASGLAEGANNGQLDEDACTSLIGNPDDPGFTAAAVETCSDLGVDLVYGEN